MVHWFLNAHDFLPYDHYEAIDSIDYDALYDVGKRALLFDVDNTIIPYDESMPSARVRELFDTIAAKGFFVVLISNNNASRIAPFAQALGLPYVAMAKKPLKRGFKRALSKIPTTYNLREVLVIGDQLMTDVYGASRVGISTILVTPIKRKSEKWYTKINRKIEEKMLEKIKRKYPEQFEALRLSKR